MQPLPIVPHRHRSPRVALAAAAIVLAGVAACSTAPTTAPPPSFEVRAEGIAAPAGVADPCGLIAPDEVTTILGSASETPYRGHDQTWWCIFVPSADVKGGIRVHVYDPGAEDLLRTIQLTAPELEAVEGIGTLAYGRAGRVYAADAGHMIALDGLDAAGEGLNLADLIPLAKLAFARL